MEPLICRWARCLHAIPPILLHSLLLWLGALLPAPRRPRGLGVCNPQRRLKVACQRRHSGLTTTVGSPARLWKASRRASALSSLCYRPPARRTQRSRDAVSRQAQAAAALTSHQSLPDICSILRHNERGREEKHGTAHSLLSAPGTTVVDRRATLHRDRCWEAAP
jgi:hypothetical protein